MDVKSAASLATVAAKQALGIMVDPVPAYRFYIFVEIGGVFEAKFTEISGLSMEREVSTHYEGGNNDRAHHLPGRVKYSNITLKRGVTFSRTLWNWFHKPNKKKGFALVEKIPVSIILYSSYPGIIFPTPARWYDLEEAFPVKLAGPDLGTDKSEVAIEELQLAYSRIKLNLPPDDPFTKFL
jgi:phage tail-like protein